MRNEDATYLSASEIDTQHIALELGKTLLPGDVVTFSGDLGSGKTTFIRGLATGSAGIDPSEVCSPTFNYLNIYTGIHTIFHFDLYRLQRAQDFLAAGFGDYLSAEGICCIEWSEHIRSILPQHRIEVNLTYVNQQTRNIEISWT